MLWNWSEFMYLFNNLSSFRLKQTSDLYAITTSQQQTLALVNKVLMSIKMIVLLFWSEKKHIQYFFKLSQSSYANVPPDLPVFLDASSPPVGSYTAILWYDQKPAQGRDPSWDHCCSCFSYQPESYSSEHFQKWFMYLQQLEWHFAGGGGQAFHLATGSARNPTRSPAAPSSWEHPQPPCYLLQGDKTVQPHCSLWLLLAQGHRWLLCSHVLWHEQVLWGDHRRLDESDQTQHEEHKWLVSSRTEDTHST